MTIAQLDALMVGDAQNAPQAGGDPMNAPRHSPPKKQMTREESNAAMKRLRSIAG